MIGGLYRGDYAEGGAKPPTAFAGLRSYWDGRDITPASGTADNWAARGGSQQSTLVNIGGLATVATRNGKRGITGRMQVNTPSYSIPTEQVVAFYVFEMPNISALRGMSSYEGKALPLIFSYSAANRFEVARGVGGTAFETPAILVSDVSSWVGKLVSVVVKMTTGGDLCFLAC